MLIITVRGAQQKSSFILAGIERWKKKADLANGGSP